MRFFSYAPVDPSSPIFLEPFGVYHVAAVAFLAAAALLVVVFRKRLREAGVERRILGIATAVAVSLEITLHLCEHLSIPFHEFCRARGRSVAFSDDIPYNPCGKGTRVADSPKRRFRGGGE